MSVLFDSTGSQFLKASGTVSHDIGNGVLTLAAWHKMVSFASAARVVAMLGFSTTARGELRSNNSASPTKMGCVFTNTASFDSDSTAIDSTAWQLMAMVRRADGKVYGYRNGVELPNQLTSFVGVVNGTPSIGARWTGSAASNYADGYIEHVCVWNVELAQCELREMYERRIAPRHYRPGGIKAYWKLDGTSGNVADGDSGLNCGISGVPMIVGGGTPTWSTETANLRPSPRNIGAVVYSIGGRRGR